MSPVSASAWDRKMESEEGTSAEEVKSNHGWPESKLSAGPRARVQCKMNLQMFFPMKYVVG